MSNGAETRILRSRAKIVAAAEDCFLHHGFLGTNMDAIAEQAGVSKQTVYAHFGSKEALFIQVVERMTDGAAHEIGEDVEDDLKGIPVRAFLLKVATDQLSIVLTPRLMRLRRMVIGEVERFPDLGKSLYENGPARSIHRIARAIDHYASTGELRPTEPLRAATHFNWLVMGGPIGSAMLLGDAGIPGKSDLGVHARECVRIFLCAFGSEAASEN